MEHMDEKIVAMMRELEEQQRRESEEGSARAAEQGVTEEPERLAPLSNYPERIGEEWVPFGQQELLGGRLLAFLPRAFRLLTPEEARLKFPSEHRPSIIYADDEGAITIAFSLSDYTLTEEGVPDFTEEMVKLLRSMQPIRRWIGHRVTERADGQAMGCCEFISPALDEPLYNYMAFVVLDGQALMCSFNCTERAMALWQPLAHRMMHSLALADGQEVEEG